MNIIRLFAFGVAVATSLGSCSSDDEFVPRNLSSEVIGTYQGTLTSNMLQTEIPSTVEVTSINLYTIQIHCSSASFDTLVTVELYPDENMMRICLTDDDFKSEYGHDMTVYHHFIASNNEWVSWQQHISSEHDENDEHFGYFDLGYQTLEYTFKIEGANGAYQKFVGTRQ